MQTTWELVNYHLEAARTKQKQQYDKKARSSLLEVCDKVLVRILALKGRYKISDTFEENIYTVIEQLNSNVPVFKVKSQNGTIKTLHMNHLMPLGSFNDVEA